MLNYLLLFLKSALSALKGQGHLVLENLALRQRLAVLKQSVKRPRLSPLDRLFGMNLEKLTVRGTEEREVAKPNGVSTRRDSLHQLRSHQEHHMDERSAEITETQKTITRLLSMANETKETETRASQTQRHVLKDLEKKLRVCRS